MSMIGRMGVTFTFAGCGDAFCSGGRSNTCFHVRHERGAFLIDCGASSLAALNRLNEDLNAVDLIVVSHLHGDHFGGVPFFLMDARYQSKRATPIMVAGPQGIQRRVLDTLELLFPG